MIYSQNEEELISIGQKLGRLLNSGDIIVLSGDLGAGKTTLTKGIAKGLDVSQMIKSPTYTIVREYEGRLPLYHLDAVSYTHLQFRTRQAHVYFQNVGL